MNDNDKLDQVIARMDALQQDPNMAVMANDLTYIKRDVADIKEQMKNNYVTRDEFTPIRNIVYGLVSLILISFVGAIVSLVLKTHS